MNPSFDHNQPNDLTPDLAASKSQSPSTAVAQTTIQMQLYGAIPGKRDQRTRTLAAGVTPRQAILIENPDGSPTLDALQGIPDINTTLGDIQSDVDLIAGHLDSMSETLGTIATAIQALAPANLIGSINFSASAEVANVIRLTITLLDAAGNAVTFPCAVDFWLADSATGGASASAATSTTFVATFGEPIQGNDGGLGSGSVGGRFVTNASGQLKIDIAKTGAQTWYPRASVAGRVYTGAVIVFV